jgi:hypothetical protein
MKPQSSTLKFLLIALSICALLPGQTPAQHSNSPEPMMADGNNCESNKAYWDLVAVEANRNNSTVIMVAQLGDSEKARRLNMRRLHNLFTYLSYIRGIPSERLIRTEGVRVPGLGRVAVYIGGKLFIVFTVERNEDLQGGSCEEKFSALYYPMSAKRRN